ncbi:sorting nexin-24 isoform X8 [Manis javanica]|uniref:sorting nexin-24 isoform X8 n=1 Tax=Manis javanica TaxID=9974 RepID=UPI00187B08B2|nr:sorting nexin-24 isoform X8 [Manis javanica]
MLGTGSQKSWNNDDKVWKHIYRILLILPTSGVVMRMKWPSICEASQQAIKYCAVILENEELPKLFLDFLNVRHLPSLPKAESCGSFEETESEGSSKLSHQPVLLFLRDPYVLPAASDFPNVVIEGVLHGIFYPHLQPRCYGTLLFSS